MTFEELLAIQANENELFLSDRANELAKIGKNQSEVRALYPDGLPKDVAERHAQELQQLVQEQKAREKAMYERHDKEREFVLATEKLNKIIDQIPNEEQGQEQPTVEQTEQDTPTQEPPAENALVEEEEIEQGEQIEQEETKTERKKREYLEAMREKTERNKDRGLER